MAEIANRLLPDELENPSVLQIGRLPARSNIIPAQKKAVFYRNKEESAFLRPLNGLYRFYYSPAGDTLPTFCRSDFDRSVFTDTIDVPSMWQYRSYGACSYPNIEYPIPFDPPYVDTACNPVGYYIRDFSVETPAARTILHFAGVDGAFYAYLNGSLVGMSKGSRNFAEFDVSSLIKPGQNTLCVKVFTYSDATYLENQDMLLASGIFRDVYLLETGRFSLWDFRVNSDLHAFTVKITLFDGFPADGRIRVTIDGNSAVYAAAKELSHTYTPQNAHLWNAEDPYLYDLSIELLEGDVIVETHSKRIGMMNTTVQNDRFLVNGTPIYIKGINRHEYDPKNGRAITVERIEKELRLIKQSGLNSIRCAHYTNHPAFYEIASELGLYVMDEADLETHGCGVTGDQGYLSQDPRWFNAYLDRVKRMLEANKNEPCIFMWSIGNECGSGENLVRCADYIRAFDPTTEVHQVQDDAVHPTFTRMRKAGYCSYAAMSAQKPEGYPVLIVEFAHAMGNSPGFLEQYFDYIYTHDEYLGGFVWEFKNHGFYAVDDHGREYYKYGGDFGDYNSWRNFTLDGFLTSDGTPKPTWHELSCAVAPCYMRFENGALTVKNTYDFITLRHAVLHYDILEDYRVVRSESVALDGLMPHETAVIPLDTAVREPLAGASYFVNVTASLAGKKIGQKQFALGKPLAARPFEAPNEKPLVTLSNGRLTVAGKTFAVRFENGVITHYESGGETLIDAPMRFNFWRAPTDNDGIFGLAGRHIDEWNGRYLSHFECFARKTEVTETENAVCVTVHGKCQPFSHYVGFDTEIRYTVYADGTIKTDTHMTPFGNFCATLPRIGVMFTLDKPFRKAAWYGRGPEQSYPDSVLGRSIGFYAADIADMNFLFDVPQETGNHENTRFVTIKEETGCGFSVIGSDEFAFSFHPFSLENLTAARHKNELIESDRNYLYIDYKMRGLGSFSCGPEPEEAFELRPHEFRFVFTLSPQTDAASVLSLARRDFGSKTAKLTDSYTYVPLAEKTKREVADCSFEE